MTLTEFKVKYGSIYEFIITDDVDSLYQVIITSSKDKGVLNNNLTLLIENDNFDIYTEFTYEENDSSFQKYSTYRDQIRFLQEFTKIAKMSPETFIDEGMGCPFSGHQIGFFNVKVNNRLISDLLENFEKALLINPDIDIDVAYMQSTFPDEMSCFNELRQGIYENLKELIQSVFNHEKYTNIANKLSDRFEYYDPVFINERGTVVLGATKECLYKFPISKTLNIVNIYLGIKHFLAKLEDQVICGDIRLVNEVLSLIEYSSLNFESDIIYKTSKDHSFLILECGEFWAIVCPIKTDLDVIISKEFAEIRALSSSLKSFISCNSIIEEYNLSSLSSNSFEKMCRDLLDSMGFKNVILRGSTNSPDGGVDIEADEVVQSLFGIETRHWIFQCKQTKSQIDRKDISEIPDLLREFEAYGYGIFYSGVLSPQTLDRIKNKDCIIKYWSKSELEILLSKNIDIATKYF